MEPSITLPTALMLAAVSSILTIGVAWGVMRATLAAQDRRTTENFNRVDKKQDQIDRDIRDGFNRIAALERSSVTYEAFADFRQEMSQGFRDLRALIETLRASPRPRKTADEP